VQTSACCFRWIREEEEENKSQKEQQVPDHE
jgi:hypothetical protein